MNNSYILLVGTATFDTHPLALLLKRAGHQVTEVSDTEAAVAALYNDVNAPYNFVITPSRIGPMPITQFLQEVPDFGAATILYYGGALDLDLARLADICIGQTETDSFGNESFLLLLNAIEKWEPAAQTA